MYHISILCRTDLSSRIPTIDRRNPANQVRSVVYPTFLSGFYTQKKSLPPPSSLPSIETSMLGVSVRVVWPHLWYSQKPLHWNVSWQSLRLTRYPEAPLASFLPGRLGRWEVKISVHLEPWFLGEVGNVSWSCEVWDVEVLATAGCCMYDTNSEVYIE